MLQVLEVAKTRPRSRFGLRMSRAKTCWSLRLLTIIEGSHCVRPAGNRNLRGREVGYASSCPGARDAFRQESGTVVFPDTVRPKKCQAPILGL
jgi:hypothetical protein